MPSDEIARVRTEENRYRVTRWSDKRTHQKTLDFHWPSKLYQFDPDVNQWRVIARWEGRLGNNKSVESVTEAVQTALAIIRGEAEEDDFRGDMDMDALPTLEEVVTEVEASYGAEDTEFEPADLDGYTPPEPEEEEAEQEEVEEEEAEVEEEEAVEA